jgi:2-dehydro-3-deoxygalactonokinase
MAKLPDKFLSCDWGTSSFRLRLVSTATNKVIDSVTASSGVKELHDQVHLRGVTRFDLFSQTATKHIETISKSNRLHGEPLIISGMASSTIGWVEIPYAAIPFGVDGADLRVEDLTWVGPDGLGKTYIVSGVASEADMMRGEETQIIGLLADPALHRFRERCLVILPGTHSKHIVVQDGKVVGLQTYMTGELFQILCAHSILSATVNGDFSDDYRFDFTDGVRWVREKGLAAAIFRVRTRSVLQKQTERANGAFLSGVLIGAELMTLDHHPSVPVIVAANEKLKTIYEWGLQNDREVVFTDSIDDATIAAHRLVLERLYK